MDSEVIGAIKIKDGLFIGDEYAAQDLEFVITNKVSHIINCAGRQIPNFWESIGVAYLTYSWTDSDNQIIFDQKGQVVHEIFTFVEEALQNGESVLVHSVKGQSRSCCVIASYFMKRFKWSLYKTLEFLTSRRPDLEIRASFYHQLTNLESKFAQENGGDISASWNESGFQNNKQRPIDHDEVLLRNTFLNAKNAPLDETLINPKNVCDIKQTLDWSDIKHGDKNKLSTYFTHTDGKVHKPIKPKSYLKSILKGSNKVFRVGTEKEEITTTATTGKSQSSLTYGLKLNKSLKTLHEEKSSAMNSSYSAILKKAVPSKVVDFSEPAPNTSQGSSGSAKRAKGGNSNSSLHNSKGQGLPRSSSASTFERDDSGFGNSSADKRDQRYSNINGNIIHVTVNNFLAPMNNVNNTINNNNHPTNTVQEENDKQNLRLVNSKEGSSKNSSQKDDKKAAISNTVTDILNSNDSFNRILNDPNVDKNSLNYLAARQLKLALEKKLSKEGNSNGSKQDNAHANKNSKESQPQNRIVKSSSQSSNLTKADLGESKENKAPKDVLHKAAELKLTYQPPQKRGETPPPQRTRDDQKKVQSSESAYTKALAKSSIMNNSNSNITQQKPRADTVQTSNYLQSLFPSSLTHLNSLTPSSNHTIAHIDKKAPQSTKATSSSSYNFGPYKAQMTLNSKYSSTQPSEKQQQSSTGQLSDHMMKPNTIMSSTYQEIPNSHAQLYSNKIQLNNYTGSGNKSTGPIKVDHSKIDRPKSANLNRSSTPNPSSNHPGRNSSMNFTASDKKEPNSANKLNTSSSNPSVKQQMGYLRSYSPSVKNNKSIMRKESPTSQNAPGKFRQRSQSPSQNPNYNNLFSTTQNKPRYKSQAGNQSSEKLQASSGTIKPPKKGSFKI